MKSLLPFAAMLIVLSACKKNNNPPPTTPPVNPPSTTGQWQVACSLGYSMVLKDDKTVWVTGSNDYGQFGNGTYTGSHKFIKVMDSVISIAATGNDVSFFIKTDNSLWVAGYTNYHYSTSGSGLERTAVPIKLFDNVKSVMAGYDAALVLTTDGILYGLGNPGNNKFATSLSGSKGTAVKIWDKGVKSMSVSESHTLFIGEDDIVYGIGVNNSDVMGQDSSDNGLPDIWSKGASPLYHLSTPFYKNSGIYRKVTAGRYVSFLVDDWSRPFALGANDHRQCGIADTNYIPSSVNPARPAFYFDGVQVFSDTLNTSDATNIYPIPGAFANYIIESTRLYACGHPDQDFGFGNGQPIKDYNRPVYISVGTGAKSIAASIENEFHAIVLATNNRIWAMGSNNNGELGDGTTTSQKVFKEITLP